MCIRDRQQSVPPAPPTNPLLAQATQEFSPQPGSTSQLDQTPTSFDAVSYTHLDVYKRQGWINDAYGNDMRPTIAMKNQLAQMERDRYGLSLIHI